MNIDPESPPSFDTLAAHHPWRPIPGCPGRSSLCVQPADHDPHWLVGPTAVLHVYHIDKVRDTVVVAQLPGGGLLSYHRANGTWLHTLNTPEGLARKLHQLGIAGT